MNDNRASRPNVVSLFFGMAIALTLITVLVASLFFNRLPQPQASDPALVAQSQQPGYSYNEAAATETLHNKSLVLVIALGMMAAAVISGIMIVSSIANRRVMRQIAQFDQNKTALNYQPVYIISNQKIVSTRPKSRV